MSTADSLQPYLPRGPVVGAFREELARRGVSGLDLFRVDASWAIHCLRCFDEAAGSLNLRHERLTPVLGEASRCFEPYEVLRYSVTRKHEAELYEDQDPRDTHTVALEGEPSRDEARVTFAPPQRYGLYRLVSRGDDGESIYYWSYEHGKFDQDSLIVGARGPATFERLVAESERLHVAHDRSRRGMILIGDGDERRRRGEDVAWEDVLLHHSLRDELTRTALEFFEPTTRELYRKHGLAYRRGVLLAGPPGNGKTTIVKAIRTCAGVPIVIAAGPVEGNGESLFESAFARAAALAPSILCFEDVDGLLEDGKALSFFLNQLDGLEPLEGVLVIATTNRPEKIDPAIARRPSRFDRVFAIAPPDRALRLAWFERALRGDDLGPALCERLAARTEGMSVAFLKELVVQARFAAVRRGEERVNPDDLDLALAAVGEHVRLASNGLEERTGFGFTVATKSA